MFGHICECWRSTIVMVMVNRTLAGFQELSRVLKVKVVLDKAIQDRIFLPKANFLVVKALCSKC